MYVVNVTAAPCRHTKITQSFASLCLKKQTEQNSLEFIGGIPSSHQVPVPIDLWQLLTAVSIIDYL